MKLTMQHSTFGITCMTDSHQFYFHYNNICIPTNLKKIITNAATLMHQSMNEICSTDLLGLTNNSKDLNKVSYI